LGKVEVGVSVVDEEVVEVSVEVGVWATGSAKTVTTGSIVVVCVTTTTASPAAVVGEATETGNITLLSLGIVDVEDPAVSLFEMRNLPAPFPKFKLI
jgi:type IV secretory pathway protease TraF